MAFPPVVVTQNFWNTQDKFSASPLQLCSQSWVSLWLFWGWVTINHNGTAVKSCSRVWASQSLLMWLSRRNNPIQPPGPLTHSRSMGQTELELLKCCALPAAFLSRYKRIITFPNSLFIAWLFKKNQIICEIDLKLIMKQLHMLCFTPKACGKWRKHYDDNTLGRKNWWD